MEAILPELEQGKKRSPEKALVCEVILLAIVDSYGNAMSLQSGADKQEAAELARVWLERSPVCRHYCVLAGIDYRAMIERLAVTWADSV